MHWPETHGHPTRVDSSPAKARRDELLLTRTGSLVIVAVAVLMAGCSRGPSTGDQSPLLDAEDHLRVLDGPICEFVEPIHLRALGLDPSGAHPEPNPFWSTCRWRSGHRPPTLTVNVSSTASMTDPVFEEQEVESVTTIADPRLERAGIVDRPPDDSEPQPCSSLMLDMGREGTGEIEICGPDAAEQVRTVGVSIADDVLAAWR